MSLPRSPGHTTGGTKHKCGHPISSGPYRDKNYILYDCKDCCELLKTEKLYQIDKKRTGNIMRLNQRLSEFPSDQKLTEQGEFLDYIEERNSVIRERDYMRIQLLSKSESDLKKAKATLENEKAQELADWETEKKQARKDWVKYYAPLDRHPSSDSE